MRKPPTMQISERASMLYVHFLYCSSAPIDAGAVWKLQLEDDGILTYWVDTVRHCMRTETGRG